MHKFYVDSYLLDVMCASKEYPSLGWKWTPRLLSIHVYCKILQENIYKEDYDRIYDGLFTSIYQIHFGKEAPCFSPEGQEIVQKYGDWYMAPNGFYIRMLGSSKAMHWLPHFVPYILLLQDYHINLILMVLLLHCIRKKRAFGLLYLYPREFEKLKILSSLRKRSIFYPPFSKT